MMMQGVRDNKMSVEGTYLVVQLGPPANEKDMGLILVWDLGTHIQWGK